MPDTDWMGAVTVAESIRTAIEDLDIPHIGSPSGRVTVSIGVAVVRPVLGEAESLIVKEADEALHDAKHTGRNRVRTVAVVTLRSRCACTLFGKAADNAPLPGVGARSRHHQMI